MENKIVEGCDVGSLHAIEATGKAEERDVKAEACCGSGDDCFPPSGSGRSLFLFSWHPAASPVSQEGS